MLHGREWTCRETPQNHISSIHAPEHASLASSHSSPVAASALLNHNTRTRSHTQIHEVQGRERRRVRCQPVPVTPTHESATALVRLISRPRCKQYTPSRPEHDLEAARQGRGPGTRQGGSHMPPWRGHHEVPAAAADGSCCCSAGAGGSGGLAALKLKSPSCPHAAMVSSPLDCRTVHTRPASAHGATERGQREKIGTERE